MPKISQCHRRFLSERNRWRKLKLVIARSLRPLRCAWNWSRHDLCFVLGVFPEPEPPRRNKAVLVWFDSDASSTVTSSAFGSRRFSP
jgi:hypothetical protein